MIAALDQHKAMYPDPDSPQRSSTSWSEIFEGAIRQIKQTVVIFSPWTTLEDAWCLWQLHCTIVNSVTLSLRLSPSDDKDFRSKLVQGITEEQTFLGRLDTSSFRKARNWRCSPPAAPGLQKVVKERLHKWIYEKSLEFLEQLDEEEDERRKKKKEEKQKEEDSTQLGTSRLMRDVADYYQKRDRYTYTNSEQWENTYTNREQRLLGKAVKELQKQSESQKRELRKHEREKHEREKHEEKTQYIRHDDAGSNTEKHYALVIKYACVMDSLGTLRSAQGMQLYAHKTWEQDVNEALQFCKKLKG
eukprot:SAG25_NODE_2095_length_1957_cov_4.774319_1_plen_302_part_10